MANSSEKVMETLRRAGYEAYLVGGCVRDILLQRQPKDFDVTTNALPEQVTAIFPKTIPVGAKFGVTVVMVGEEQIEVATFRADGNYSDGRRPDTVEYGKSAKEDVKRRDFTINGLLCLGEADSSTVANYNASLSGATDHVTVGGRTYGIVDYVGGYADVQRGIIRAIGDPNKRFEEDALRMLRAVRFAAQLGFEIEKETLEAIERNAPLMKQISRERVAMELFKMLSAPQPLKGILPFITTGLFRYALPAEFAQYVNMTYVLQRFGMFEANKDPMLGMAMLFADTDTYFEEKLANYLKFSTEQKNELVYMVDHVQAFGTHLRGAYTMSEATLKRKLRTPGVALALEIMTQDEVMGKTSFGIEALMSFVLKVRAYKPEEIKPTPLVTGKDLIDAGIPPSSIYTSILFDIESYQLNGTFTTKEQAMEFVRARVYQNDFKQWVYMGLTPQEAQAAEN
jgi:tRNA nucleotidyltransferase/poly(A) polymerase